jgi:hypothetical protein
MPSVLKAALGDAIALGVQLTVGIVRVGNTTARVTPLWAENSKRMRLKCDM